jgi:hypothetical protein
MLRRLSPILALLLLTTGCDDGWYSNIRAYYTGAGDDDDLVLDDDDTGVDDDDTGVDDDDTGVDDDDTGVDDDDTNPDDDDTNPDDDDTSVDDDDTSVDDDDTSVDDDDTSVDDDDTSVDDDDTTLPDDDDFTPTPDFAVAMSVRNGLTEDFGTLGINNQETRVVRVENVGQQIIILSPYLDTTASGLTFTLSAPTNAVLTPFSFQDWTITFNPLTPGTYVADFVARYEPSLGPPPGPFEDDVLTFSGEAFDPNAGELICDDELDDDLDGDIDCDDSDCVGAVACGGTDWCCFGGDTFAYNGCLDGTALSCTCNIDPNCCDGVGSYGWIGACADIYAIDCNSTSCDSNPFP